ncbi:MAG: hypothetical protein E6R04_10930 [Spirochaetes bacterium]|nr:MAG: hypothetical protein E6R04_10930 [Spirochaetota bacterium]
MTSLRRSDRASAAELDELFNYRTKSAQAVLDCEEVFNVSSPRVDVATEVELIRENLDDYMRLDSGVPRTSDDAQRLIHENARIAANLNFRLLNFRLNR